MSLSQNIRQFRKDKGISQEYMAEKLHMSQPTYYRLEQRDSECIKRLPQIAHALDTTPEVLQEYHAASATDLPSETDDPLEELLAEKESVIQSQQEHIQVLTLFIEYTQSIWRNYL